jgi:hypothetical protein
MARFGKMAALPAHKSAHGVPCIVSWAENACSGSDGNGGSSRYYVEVQRYQGDVSEEDAKAGKADSNPYIVNKRMSYSMGGKSHSKIDHQTSLYAGAMHAIESVSQSDVITTKRSMKSLFAQATAEASGEKAPVISDGVAVHHYFVKLNVGFGNNEAFIYIPKADALGDPRGRNMPLPAGELTQEMLDRHENITRLAKEAAQELYGANYQSGATSEREIPEVPEDTSEESTFGKGE